MTIYVCTHKRADMPKDSVYLPLHVGRAAASDLGYPGDDTGDSISAKNYRYGELTGLYWIWKNSPEKDIVGLCHYRRFFLNASGEILSGEELARLMEAYDIVVSKEMDAKKPYLSYYNEAHDPAQQMLVRKALSELYPADVEVYDAVMAQPYYYYGNLCVTRRERLNAYSAWLFVIMSFVEERLDVSAYDAYHGRVYGFLSEQLLRVWIEREGLGVVNCPIGITQEKAETTEFKLAMRQLVKEGRFAEARGMYDEILKLRPDLALELSDIRGEIPVIGCVLYILHLEEEAGEKSGMYAYSKDLPELIAHYRRLSAIVEEKKENTRDAREYLKRTLVTDTALEVVRRNIIR